MLGGGADTAEGLRELRRRQPAVGVRRHRRPQPPAMRATGPPTPPPTPGGRRGGVGPRTPIMSLTMGDVCNDLSFVCACRLLEKRCCAGREKVKGGAQGWATPPLGSEAWDDRGCGVEPIGKIRKEPGGSSKFSPCSACSQPNRGRCRGPRPGGSPRGRTREGGSRGRRPTPP